MENKGFTLIELLIVIAIIGILVGIALPSYQAHVKTGNRIDAQFAMNSMALVAERQYARQNSYPSDAAATGVNIPSSYSITFTPATAPDRFVIEATPSTAQTGETCATMTLIQTGAGTPASCW